MKKLNVKLLASAALALFAGIAPGQTLVQKWANTSVLGANQQFVDGAVFNASTGNLIVCEAAATPTIMRLSAVDGSSIGNMTVTGVSGGTYGTSGLAIDASGVIYGCNYAAAGATKLYSWANETASPANFANSTLGAGSVGKTMGIYGSGNNAVFIVSSSTTAGIYVYYNDSAWTSKQLTVASQTLQGGITILSWSSTACSFITKNSSGSGNSNFFNPSSASPITVTQTAFTAAPMAFVTLSGTATPAQGAGGYDPTTGLYAFHTRALTASPFTISNYLVATAAGTAGLSAPAGCTPVLSRLGYNQTGVDTANYGVDFWGNGVYYCAPAVNATGYGLRAFDISPYKVTDATPLSQTKNIGDTASISVVSGGSGTLTYLWKKNGSQINNGGDYAGATNAMLTINPVGAGDAGTYTCTVTGAGGLNWTSTNALLIVNLPAATNTVSLTTGADPSTYGNSLVFTATLSGSGATPTGTVIFEDGSTPFATNTLSGGTSACTNAALGAGAHSIISVYSGDSNYPSNSSAPLSQTVNPLAASLSGSRPYDATTGAASGILTVANKVGTDDVSLASGAGTLAGANVGSEAIASTGSLALGGTTAVNYTLAGAAGSVNVTAVPLTITAGAQSKTYGSALNLGTTDFTVGSGLAGSENVTAVTLAANGGTASNAPVSGSPYTISPSAASGTGGFSAANYNITYATNSLTVNPLAATLDGARNYDGTTNAAASILAVANAVGGDDVALTNGPAGLGSGDIGTNAITSFGTLALKGTTAGNYTLVGASGTVTITPAPVALAGTRGYDGTNDAASGILTITNAAGSDDVALASGSAVLAGSAAGLEAISSAGTLALSGVTASNYTLSGLTGAVNITAVPLTITAQPQSITYGATVPSTTVNYSGFVGGDTAASLTTLPSISSAQSGIAAAGTYAGNYTASGAVDPNYSISYAAGDLQVNPLTAILSGNRAYDGTASAVAGILAVANKIGGDDVALASGSAVLAGSAVGLEAISSAGTLALSGVTASNYTLSGATGAVNVTAVPLTITAQPQSITYGATVPATTVNYSGFVGGDTAASLTTLPSISSAQSGVAAAGTYAGNYTASGAVDPNYSISYIAGTLQVNPLTVILTGHRAYDGTASADAGILTVSNKVGSDDVALASGSAVLASSFVGTNAITSVGTLALGGTTAANYSLLGAGGSVTITNPGLPFSIVSVYTDPSGSNLITVLQTVPGSAYQMMGSDDLLTWTNEGASFTASNTLTTNVIASPATFGGKSKSYIYKNSN
jgi:hypothetical protein